MRFKRSVFAPVVSAGLLRVTAVAGAVGTVGALAPGALAAPAAPANAGVCTNTDGVTVVVDFGTLGGGVSVGCAVGPQRSALDALANAGFAWRGTTRFPTFVCRILDKPADAACRDASPVSATWVYWTVSPSGDWAYSNVGAAGTATAAPGSVQGWSWSTGSNPKPSIAPPKIASTTTAPPTNAPMTNAPTSAPSAPATAPAKPQTTNPAAVPVPGAAGGGVSPSQQNSQSNPNLGAAAVPQPDPAVPQPDPTVDPSAVDASVLAETTAPADAAEAPAAGDGEVAEQAPTNDEIDASHEVAAGAVTVSTESSGAPVGTIVGVGALVVGAATATVITRKRRVAEQL